jgi:SAM-dependent methyltransferase
MNDASGIAPPGSKREAKEFLGGLRSASFGARPTRHGAAEPLITENPRGIGRNRTKLWLLGEAGLTADTVTACALWRASLCGGEAIGVSESKQEVPYYRYAVGMRSGYDRMAAVQVSLLWSLGLRETHRLCDVGCGSLRGGRLLIPYLLPGNYYGIEPNQRLLEDAIEHEVGSELLTLREAHFDYGDDFGIGRFGMAFDFILAQSIFSHTYRDLTSHALEQIVESLALDGLFVGTFIEKFPVILPQGERAGPDDGSGWRTTPSGVVYTWREWTELCSAVGLKVRRIRWWHHRQTWFVAVHADKEQLLTRTLRSSRSELRGAGMLGDASRRAMNRLRRTRRAE